MSIRSLSAGMVVLGLALVGGCGSSYYKVSDINTNKVYYTQQLNRSNTGALSFTNARDGAQITLQNSSVESITKQQYENAKAEVAPAP